MIYISLVLGLSVVCFCGCGDVNDDKHTENDYLWGYTEETMPNNENDDESEVVTTVTKDSREDVSSKTTTVTTTNLPETTTGTTNKPTETTTVTTAKSSTNIVNMRDVFDIDNNSMMEFLGKNSVSGLQYIFFAKYINEKRIKYFTFNYSMYNSVDDPAYDSITGKSTFSKKYSGPTEKDDFIIDISDNSVYSKSCEKLQLDSIILEYFDGTTDLIMFNVCIGRKWYGNITNEDWSLTLGSLMDRYPELYENIQKRVYSNGF